MLLATEPTKTAEAQVSLVLTVASAIAPDHTGANGSFPQAQHILYFTAQVPLCLQLMIIIYHAISHRCTLLVIINQAVSQHLNI